MAARKRRTSKSAPVVKSYITICMDRDGTVTVHAYDNVDAAKRDDENSYCTEPYKRYVLPVELPEPPDAEDDAVVLDKVTIT